MQTILRPAVRTSLVSLKRNKLIIGIYGHKNHGKTTLVRMWKELLHSFNSKYDFYSIHKPHMPNIFKLLKSKPDFKVVDGNSLNSDVLDHILSYDINVIDDVSSLDQHNKIINYTSINDHKYLSVRVYDSTKIYEEKHELDLLKTNYIFGQSPWTYNDYCRRLRTMYPCVTKIDPLLD